MKLTAWQGVPNRLRIRVMRLMLDMTDAQWDACVSIESAAHAIATTQTAYLDKMRQVIFNLRSNPKLLNHGEQIVVLSDTEMAKGTVIEDIRNQTLHRQHRFDQMLQEKCELINDQSLKGMLKCRRCGSNDVSWDQKQTRGADEAMTVFATCSKCNNRWTMR